MVSGALLLQATNSAAIVASRANFLIISVYFFGESGGKGNRMFHSHNN